MKIEKINDNSNITSNSTQIDILKKNFPNCFDKDGKFIPSKMSEIFNQNDISKESYSLNWLGKSYARLLANENPLTLIKEDKTHNSLEENINSQNLLIKGDNLEVLKHLKNAYSESIKMIYIDPPYNTGSDGFVYNDKRKFSIDELSQLAGVSLDEAKDILDFTNSKSNSHSAWLTFMYPRLYIARELLKDDGVIFISIDDNEVAQLRLLCDEIFGEDNFVNQFIWLNNSAGRQIQGSGSATTKEYILCYSREINKVKEFLIEGTYAKKVMSDIYKGFDFDIKEDERGRYITTHELNNGNSMFNENTRPNLVFDIFYNPYTNEVKTGNVGSEIDNSFVRISPKEINSGNNKFYAWRWSRDKVINEFYDLDFIETNSGWKVFTKRRDFDKTVLKDMITNITTLKGSNDLSQLELNKIFDYPKPVELIKILANSVMNDNDTILDFFAGSGTTAHSVIDLNKKDNGNRKFITVQLAESIDPTKNKTAYDFVKDELQEEPTIFEITKERIKRATKKIKDENPNYDGDLGFKIYETTPLFDGYGDDIELSNQTLFDPKLLSDDDIETILTTYKLYDGINLNQKSKDVTLKQYKCHLVEDKIYFMNSGFETIDLKVFIEKLDNDKEFNPTKIIIFGYNFLSKHQREISEAIKNYSNKKSLDIEILVRY
jgi:adenine-specific DNA-methyltransferase